MRNIKGLKNAIGMRQLAIHVAMMTGLACCLGSVACTNNAPPPLAGGPTIPPPPIIPALPQSGVGNMTIDQTNPLSLVLNWTATTGALTKYKIIRNNTNVGAKTCLSGQPCSYIDSSVSSTSYDYVYHVDLTDPSGVQPDVTGNLVEAAFDSNKKIVTSSTPTPSSTATDTSSSSTATDTSSSSSPSTSVAAYSASFLSGFTRLPALTSGMVNQIPSRIINQIPSSVVNTVPAGICIDSFVSVNTGVNAGAGCDLSQALAYCVLTTTPYTIPSFPVPAHSGRWASPSPSASPRGWASGIPGIRALSGSLAQAKVVVIINQSNSLSSNIMNIVGAQSYCNQIGSLNSNGQYSYTATFMLTPP